MIQQDPYRLFRFEVEIDGIISGGFSEVSGVSAETSVKTFREGGVNDMEYKLPEYTKFPNLELKRGLTDSSELWEWYEKVIHGNIERKNGTIIMKNDQGNPTMRWSFLNGFPIKWDGPVFNASSSTLAVEKIVIAYESLMKI